VLALTLAGLLELRRAFGGESEVPSSVGPEVSASPSEALTDVGFGFPVCRISSVPIQTAIGNGTALVATQSSDGGCPAWGDGQSFVGVDIDGDGAVDAFSGPLQDCYLTCEALAAPDVNGDGTAEVAVSTGPGGLGFDVRLFAVAIDPATIGPIHVEVPVGAGTVGNGELEFNGEETANHAAGADCNATGNPAPTLVVYTIDKFEPNALVRSTVIEVHGTSATVVDAKTSTVPIDKAPVPGNHLCGAPFQGSAALFPEMAPGPGAEQIPGVPYPMCRPTSIPGAFGPGLDTVWVFEEERVPGSGCVGSEGFQRMAVGGGGEARIITGRITDVISDEAWRVWAYAAPDINADGIDEIAIAVRGGDTGLASADSRRIWLFRVDGNHVIPITADCGPGCRPAPWSAQLGPVQGAHGPSTAGLYCGSLEGPTADPSLVGLVEWQTDPRDPLLVSETLWQVRGGQLETVAETTYRAPDIASYPPTGLSDLCGVPTSPPPVFSTGAY